MQDHQIAAILRIGLLLDYFTLGQVQRWCEQRLLSLDGDQANPFIDLYNQLPRGKNHTLASLSRIEGNSENCCIAKAYFFGFYRYAYFNGCNSHTVESELVRFYDLNEFCFDHDEEFVCLALKDESGIACNESLGGEVLSEFLLAYESFDEIQETLDSHDIGRPSIPVRQTSGWLD